MAAQPDTASADIGERLRRLIDNNRLPSPMDKSARVASFLDEVPPAPGARPPAAAAPKQDEVHDRASAWPPGWCLRC